jgi:hypothetical protein
MVLDDEGTVIAERLRLDEVFDIVVESGGAIDVRSTALRLCGAEKSETHGLPPFRAASVRIGSRKPLQFFV